MFELYFLILIPLAAAVPCYFFKDLRIQYFISLLAAVIHFVFSILIFSGLMQLNESLFLHADSISRLFLLVLSNAYFWVILVSYSYIKKSNVSDSGKVKRFYFFLLNFFLFANTAAIVSNNFGIYWVASEATTLSVAPLIYYYSNDEALEAMWKYLFLVSIGIAFAFIGILFLTLSSKGTSLEGEQLFFAVFVKNASQLNSVWLKAAFIFIFVGMSVKIGIAPMHSADIDATSNSPGPAAALMAASLRVTALLGVLRIFQIVSFTSVSEFAKTLMITGGLFSILVSFIFMFKVKNYKRLLAYSSVEHLGLITLGIGIGGLAFIGAMYHIVYNSINKLTLFFTAGNIHRKFRTREVKYVSAVLKVIPLTGWLFLISFFAISAIPPFGIFFSELMIFEGMFMSDNYVILAAVMFLMLFIFINMGRTLFKMLYGENTDKNILAEKENFDIIHFASIILLVLLILIAVLSPEALKKNISGISRDFGIKL